MRTYSFLNEKILIDTEISFLFFPIAYCDNILLWQVDIDITNHSTVNFPVYGNIRGVYL